MAILMKILLSFTGVLLFLCNLNVAGIAPKYVIVTPEKIRPGQPLDIYFEIENDGENFPTSAAIVFSLEGTNYMGRERKETVILSKKFDMDITKPNIVFLDIPFDIDQSFAYSLNLKADGEIRYGTSIAKFKNSTKINFDKKSMSIFIQTDKSMYKPGQMVNFRVISVYPDLKPFDKLLNIEIFDPRNNKIVQKFNATQEFKGVVSDNLQLSDQPIEGTWKITAQYGTEKVEKTFIVEEYVLPKFEVKIKSPSYIVYDDKKNKLAPITEDIHFTTEVLYTHGKPVEGSVVVDITMYKYCSYRCPKYKTIQKSGQLNKLTGRADFTLSSEDILSMTSTRERWRWEKLEIQFNARATETVSGITLNGTGKTTVRLESFTTEFLSSTPENYKLGLLYTGFWKVTQIDGSPITEEQLKNEKGDDEVLSVEIGYIWQYNKTINGRIVTQSGTEEKRVKTFPIPKSGLVFVTFTPPKSNIIRDMWFDTIKLMATFKTKRTYKSLSQFVTKKTKVGLQMTVQNDGGINPDEELKVLMTTTVAIPSFTYILISRGRLIFNGEVSMDGLLEREFSIFISKDISRKIAPSARLLSFYKSVENEMVADSIEFNVNGLFSNDVKISFNKDQVSPGENIDLNIQASPHSFLGLLAVDTSVLLLGGGNDLESKDVMTEVKKYDSSSHNYFPYERRFRRKRSIMPWPMRWGAQDTSAVLTNAGVRMMTDALIYKKIIYRYPEYFPGMPGVPGMAGSGPRGQEGQPGPPTDNDGVKRTPETDVDTGSVSVRKLFPETWLYFNKAVG
ncbi:DgyrCDS381 [Dimorphilus gyrociliatus]|uniref:DgyrCDS381 n=1 Tax=Dimorphilus gyrociliatus TaxID=2664684 RepID=A0A7I8V6Y2_9ANNE|nr:DgyrCDS381 [Dimorphilus gyrociliatus]